MPAEDYHRRFARVQGKEYNQAVAEENKYFDAHTHAHFAAFRDDYRDVIRRAADAGVLMIAVGTQKDTSRRAVEVAREFRDSVWAAVGLHPIHTEASHHDEKELGQPDGSQTNADGTRTDAEGGFIGRGEIFDYDYYKKLALERKVVAIGECGLDFYRLSEQTKDKQMAALDAQIELSREVKKPLMIHCRKAFGDLILFLGSRAEKLSGNAGVVHFFTGTENDARMLMDLGFSFTFGGAITFTRDYDDVVKFIPVDHILSETDAPYVAPEPHRGKRNEPAYVVETVKKLAELKGVSPEKMREHIWTNANRIFDLS